MPRFAFLALVCLLLFFSNGFAQKVYTVADYDRASTMLSTNFSKYINNSIQPQWLEDGTLWYGNPSASGISYVRYNPKDNIKTTAPSKKELLKDVPIQVEKPKISRLEALSPDGTKAVFIRDWNLWFRDVKTDKETQLTTDGIKDFGYATDNAGWTHSDRPIISWSPDSKKIATFQQDQRHVSDMYLVRTTVGAQGCSLLKNSYIK